VDAADTITAVLINSPRMAWRQDTLVPFQWFYMFEYFSRS